MEGLLNKLILGLGLIFIFMYLLIVLISMGQINNYNTCSEFCNSTDITASDIETIEQCGCNESWMYEGDWNETQYSIV